MGHDRFGKGEAKQRMARHGTHGQQRIARHGAAPHGEAGKARRGMA